uniref:hypothetical protein n=1 Tax=Labilibaculum sp. TaxID=2060723 RepID=UPI00356A1F72
MFTTHQIFRFSKLIYLICLIFLTSFQVRGVEKLDPQKRKVENAAQVFVEQISKDFPFEFQCNSVQIDSKQKE